MNVTTPYYRSVKVQLVSTRYTAGTRSGPATGYTNINGFHSSPFPRIPSTLRLLKATEQPAAPLLKSTIEKETLASRSAEMAKAKAAKEASEAASGIAGEGAVVEPKKSLWVRFKNEMIHYWHGTKLLGKEIKISTKLAGRLLNGNKLTRREQRQASYLGYLFLFYFLHGYTLTISACNNWSRHEGSVFITFIIWMQP